MLLTISNLFPRPDQPQRGLFNVQLFREFARQLGGGVSEQWTVNGKQWTVNSEQRTNAAQPLLNLCLVPEWRLWRWGTIRRWKVDEQTAGRRRQAADPGEEGTSSVQSSIPNLQSPIFNLQSLVPTLYLPVFYVPRFGRDRMADTYYRGLRNLHVTVRGTRAIFAAWLYPDGVAAARLARDLSVPCWIMVQGSDVFHLQHPRRLKALMDVIDDIHGFVCVCQPLAETLIKAGVGRSRVHVVPNGVDRELFKYRSKTEAVNQLTVNSKQLTVNSDQLTVNDVQAGQTDDPGRDKRRLSTVHCSPFTAHSSIPLADIVAGRLKLVLFVGNLVPVKGPDVFLKSLATLKSRVQGPWSIVSVFVGSGPMLRDLESAARRWGLGETVHFLGSRPHDEVARWMNLADVLCLTSRSEGMPNVVIEGLVSGVPVAVTDVGACRELVENEPEARLCLRGDTQALARSIHDLAFSTGDRRALAARHAERFSWARQAGTILGLMGMRGGQGSKQ